MLTDLNDTKLSEPTLVLRRDSLLEREVFYLQELAFLIIQKNVDLKLQINLD